MKRREVSTTTTTMWPVCKALESHASDRVLAVTTRCKHRSRLLILGLLAWYGATRQLYTHGREMF